MNRASPPYLHKEHFQALNHFWGNFPGHSQCATLLLARGHQSWGHGPPCCHPIVTATGNTPSILTPPQPRTVVAPTADETKSELLQVLEITNLRAGPGSLDYL